MTLQINGNTVFSDIERQNISDGQIMFAKPIQMGGNISYPFIGKLTDLNVWNGSNHDVEISKFASCSFTDIYAVNLSMPIQWKNVTLDMKNYTIKKFNLTLDKICSDVTSPKLILFHKQVTFEQAYAIAKQLNGEMVLPINQEDFNKALKADVTNLRKNCLNNIWLPIVRSEKNETIWLNKNNLTESVTFLPWMTGQPNGYPSQNCITAEQNGYYDSDCNEKRCFVGMFKKSPIFHLRGQCRMDPATDNLYVFNFESITKSVYKFQGFSGLSDIIGDFYTNYWDIITYNSTTGYSNEIGYLRDVSKFPFGTNSFNFYIGGRLPMKISKVNAVEAA